jgi:hypothetical protein
LFVHVCAEEVWEDMAINHPPETKFNRFSVSSVKGYVIPDFGDAAQAIVIGPSPLPWSDAPTKPLSSDSGEEQTEVLTAALGIPNGHGLCPSRPAHASERCSQWF